ncbi:MAG TPA: hypothetical protein VK906_09815 [Egicoccus sp.]|nr:hypothetical protein [Egicoccus sp.]HSK23462.1 hypothetical protein [Egicoccus sp.]
MGHSQTWGTPTAGVETARRLLSWFTGALAAGALLVLTVQAVTGVEGATEALLVLLVLMGALLLAGARRDRRHEVAADRSIAAGTAAAIDALDRVEHRRLELGTPWPQLVVGPTGVSIVEMCPSVGPLHLTPAGVQTVARRQACERCAAARSAADRARQLLAGIEDGRRIPVRVLAVVAPGTPVSRDPEADDLVDAVPADRLSDTLARGPVLPMPLVDRAFARLASMAGALVDK